MIFYFSGTGNSKYIAQRIADAVGGGILPVASHTPYAIPDNGESIGLVFPVYFWGIPTAAVEFLSALQIKGIHYFYLVLNCGGSTGDASGMAEKLLGRKFDAIFSVQMPDTYAPMFNVSDAQRNQSILDKAEPAIDAIIQLVKERKEGNFDRHRGGGRLYTATMYPSYKRKTTKKFSILSSCVGCGKCAEVCPDDVISLHGGKPHWREGHCNLCFACLHHCPQHAILYGKGSHKHGQYLCPRVKE